MNFQQAKNGGEEERSQYLQSLDLSWASNYIGKRRYIHKKKRTQAQIIIPKLASILLKKQKSELQVFKGPFKGTNEQFFSLLRDHEGKHAHLTFYFPEVFDLGTHFFGYRGVHEVRHLVEEIICDEFQIREAEQSGIDLGATYISELKGDIKRHRSKLSKITKGGELDNFSQSIVSILSGDHKHSQEIRFGK